MGSRDVSLLLIGLLLLSGSYLHLRTAGAETPSAIRAWPYQLIVRQLHAGGAAIHAGDEVSYSISYTLREDTAQDPPAFIFKWTPEAAAFVSSEVTAGPPGVMDVGPASVRWDFSGPTPFGEVEVTLRANESFSGELVVGANPIGTGNVLPANSVNSATTEITRVRISIVPSSGPCGSLVRVTGALFPPNADVYVAAIRARDGGELNIAPTTKSGSDGAFDVEVFVSADICPWPQGLQIFSCALPSCSERAVVPFSVVGMLPTAGTGGSLRDAQDLGRGKANMIVLLVALVGGAVLISGIGTAIRR